MTRMIPKRTIKKSPDLDGGRSGTMRASVKSNCHLRQARKDQIFYSCSSVKFGGNAEDNTEQYNEEQDDTKQ